LESVFFFCFFPIYSNLSFPNPRKNIRKSDFGIRFAPFSEKAVKTLIGSRKVNKNLHYTKEEKLKSRKGKPISHRSSNLTKAKLEMIKLCSCQKTIYQKNTHNIENNSYEQLGRKSDKLLIGMLTRLKDQRNDTIKKPIENSTAHCQSHKRKQQKKHLVREE
jgi:hypothetical protein